MKNIIISEDGTNFNSGEYYEILGVSKDATTEEIKRAFRKLAATHHPDKDGEKEHFQLIKKAYDILSNNKARQHYDLYGIFSDEEITKANNFVREVIIQAVDSAKSLEHVDIVSLLNKNIDQNMIGARNHIHVLENQISKIEKNKHRTTSELVLHVFNTKQGVAEKNLENTKKELRVLKAALLIIEDVNYNFEPVDEIYVTTPTGWR